MELGRASIFLCSPFGVLGVGFGRGVEEGGDAGGVGCGGGRVEVGPSSRVLRVNPLSRVLRVKRVVEDDARGEVVVGGGALGEGVAAVKCGYAAEEELADVGDGDGVEARDAFASELADEIAEERVDGVRR